MISANMPFFRTFQGKPLSILTPIYVRTKVCEVQIKDKMKNSILALLSLATLSGFSQDSEYEVSSCPTKGRKAPNTHYIAEARLNAIIHDDAELGYNSTKATLKANSTLDWHKHGSAQVLLIVDGEAY